MGLQKIKSFNIAVVGLGGVAQVHLQGFELLPHVTIVCCRVDVRQDVVTAIPDKYQARMFSV